jgi:hypothetical protein
MLKEVNPLRHKKTRFPRLTYANIGHGYWSVFEDGNQVGSLYRSRIELLADLERYATERGY